jgi:hypothetical protein
MRLIENEISTEIGWSSFLLRTSAGNPGHDPEGKLWFDRLPEKELP